MDALIAAAKAEGGLNTIALPRDWCNYGAAHRRLHRQVRDPDQRAQPRRRLEGRARGDQGQQGQPRPAGTGRRRRRPVLRPAGRRPRTSSSRTRSRPGTRIPRLGQGRRRPVVRRLLRRPVVRGQHQGRHQRPEGLGRPARSPTTRTWSRSPATRPRRTRRTPAVWAAGLLATAATLDNAEPGLDFFKKLNDAGNFVPVIGKPATVASGETPIRLAGPTTRLADKDSLKGNPPIEVVVPTTGRFGGMYVQAISAYAPHPNAAKLWMEYLYSDEGQNVWLKGYCNPIRYDDMLAKGTVDHGRRGQAPGHQGRRPSDPRPDHQGDRRDRQGLADHRRRDSQVARHRLAADGSDVGDCHDRPGRATGAPWATSIQLDVARPRPVLRLRRPVPPHPDVLPRRRELPGQGRPADAPELRRPRLRRRSANAFFVEHRDQPRDRGPRRDLRLPARLRRHRRRAARPSARRSS